jgi:hypothetical protein
MISETQELVVFQAVVKHASYAPKAVALLGAPVTDPKNPEQGMDQIQFWQLTAVQLIGDLKFTGGVKSLVTVLMTPAKRDLTFPVRLALHKMPKEAEPVLIQALKGEGDFSKLAEGYPEKAYVPLIAEPLAYISRPAGKDAIVEALAKADNDSNRTILATYLTYFPTDAKLIKAYTDAYAKVAGAEHFGGLDRQPLAQINLHRATEYPLFRVEGGL